MSDGLHLGEEDLVLHYYGEPGAPAVAEHLAACAACRAEWDALRTGLDAVRASAEEPDAPPVDAVWARLLPELTAARRPRTWARHVLPPLAAAAALLLAIQLGRHRPGAPPPTPSAAPSTADARGRERILLVAVGDHLERTQMLLVELSNAPGERATDIGSEQQQAVELVSANRLYRQAAEQAGEPAVASLLDELERVLVEVARGPETLQPAALAQLQKRIESRGLLFKVRVLESHVRQKQKTKEAPLSGVSVS
jgi:hypothetical protein